MAIRFYIVLFWVFTAACSPAKKEQPTPAGTYFSIIDFAKDQWDTYHGQPFGMVKKVYYNDNMDSIATNAMEVDWASVLKVFFETDISKPEMVGKYNFSTFDDATTMTRSFYYEAKDEKLYTRTLQVMADYYTDKIKSIYIVARRNDRISTKNVRLFYVPMESITIQEIETSKTGQKKELRIVYEFM